MQIIRSGASSYYCADLAGLTAMLEQHGYTAGPGRSSYEASRWSKARSLLVVYHNGTILMQGADTVTPRRLFDSLIGQDQIALPF
jgi:hypothetical protein